MFLITFLLYPISEVWNTEKIQLIKSFPHLLVVFISFFLSLCLMLFYDIL